MLKPNVCAALFEAKSRFKGRKGAGVVDALDNAISAIQDRLGEGYCYPSGPE